MNIADLELILINRAILCRTSKILQHDNESNTV